MSKKILEAKNLTKVYTRGDSKIYAVNDVNMEINQGDFLAIVGKSGSGKSTLMHLIGLLDTPSSGQIKLNGDITSEFNDAELAKIRNKEIGFVFQSFNLLARATALENVILPLKYSEVDKKEWKDRSESMLRTVGLGDRMLNKSNELSGGQRQRVAIARALVTKPSIVLADEPTGNLDTKTGEDIIGLFKKLHGEGSTIVLVTHDEELADVAKRKIVLRDGKIIEQT